MDYIVFDLEWNQSNDGKEKEVKEIPFEIIRIDSTVWSNQEYIMKCMILPES